MPTKILPAFPVFFDNAGAPLNGGALYIGTANANPESNPIQVYLDESLTVPLTQPISISGGFPVIGNGSPINLYVAESVYSMTVRDSSGSMVRTYASITNYLTAFKEDLASTTSTTLGSYLVGVFNSVTGYVGRKLSAWIASRPYYASDFGLSTTNTAAQNDTALAALYAALTDGDEVHIAAGVYPYSGLAISKNIKLVGSSNIITTGSTNGTVLQKSATATAIGLDLLAQGAEVHNLTVDGLAGNTGDGIRLKAGRQALKSVSVFSQGGNGIVIGDSSTANCNTWYLEKIISGNNTGHGLKLDGAATPDTNGGTLIGADLRNNGGNGLELGNTWVNSFEGLTIQSNTGYGIHGGSNAKDNKIKFSDIEGNTAGQILFDSGSYRNLVIGSDVAFTDNGKNAFMLASQATIGGVAIRPKLRVGLDTSASGLDIGTAYVGISGTYPSMYWFETDPLAANEGLWQILVNNSTWKFYSMQDSGGSGHTIISVSRTDSLPVVSLMDESVQFDTSVVGGDTRMLLWDCTKGSLQRVTVGAADSGGVGYKVLRVPN